LFGALSNLPPPVIFHGSVTGAGLAEGLLKAGTLPALFLSPLVSLASLDWLFARDIANLGSGISTYMDSGFRT
jgi:hypothetical protein